MKRPRRQFLRLAAGAAALPCVSRIARAQAYPTRLVRVIVGFGPGGATDVIARIVASGFPSDWARHSLLRTGREQAPTLQPRQS
jgi:hypothetical protein